MDHEVIVKSQSVEKYLLGELQAPEREAFEQHFFECAECAEDVRLGFQFKENATAVFRREPRQAFEAVPAKTKSRDWLAWLSAMMPRPMVMAPMAAALAVCVFSGYQNMLQIPAMRAQLAQMQSPQVLSAVVLAPAARSSQAQLPAIVVSPSVSFFQLTLATAAVTPAASYRCALRSAAGKPIKSVPVSKLEPGADLTLLIPAASFSTGEYEAVLVGVNGGIATELDHYRFQVRR